MIPKSGRYHNRFTLYDPESAIEFSDLIEIHTLELPKLPETADNYLWHWLRFLRAKSREDLEMVAQASPKLKKTVVKLLELSEDEEARMIYEAEVKALRDERARMRGAFEKGAIQGKNEKALEIARNLIDIGMPVEKIAAATALSYEEIEKVRAEST